MDLAVGASLLPMDGGEPGIWTSDLKACRIDHNATATLRPSRQDEVPAPAAQGGGIGDRQRDARELEHRTHEADALAKRQAINLLQEQPKHDGLIRIDDGTTPVCRGALVGGPRGGKIAPEPDGQAAAVGQLMIIFFPAHFLFEKPH